MQKKLAKGHGIRRVAMCALGLLLAVSGEARDGKRLLGFDGGMMVHTGWLSGMLDPAIDYKAEGLPVGIGGVIHLHVSEHFRVGSEGYVSTLSQLGNGSHLTYGWGGLLADYHINAGRFLPYAGLTLGGGALRTLLMFARPASAWAPIDGTRFHKQGFLAVAPFLGCDFVVSAPMHLTLKLDWLFPVSASRLLPHGPRLYLGFLFYH